MLKYIIIARIIAVVIFLTIMAYLSVVIEHLKCS